MFVLSSSLPPMSLDWIPPLGPTPSAIILAYPAATFPRLAQVALHIDGEGLIVHVDEDAHVLGCVREQFRHTEVSFL